MTSTTGFSITQNMLYHGPFIGVRLSGGGFQALPAQWYVEGKIVPFAYGSYRFSWAGSYNDNDPIFGPGFLNGKQTTNAKGLRRYAFEVKGGTHVDLMNRAFLDVWAKYLYVYMNGSTPEVQSESSNFGFGVLPSYSQQADQTVSMNVNFWGVGGDLVLPF